VAAGRRGAGEEGRAGILGLGLIVVLLSLILVVSAITQVAIAQRKLLGLADGAAAAGLEAFAASPAGDGAAGLRLDPPRARAAVADYLASAAPESGLESVTVTEVRVEADGVTLSVGLRAGAGLFKVGAIVPATVAVAGDGRARLGLAP
jgi:hypothetical protein